MRNRGSRTYRANAKREWRKGLVRGFIAGWAVRYLRHHTPLKRYLNLEQSINQDAYRKVAHV